MLLLLLLIIELQPVHALHVVDSLNVKHELRLKKKKQVSIMQTFPNDISRFAT